MKPSSRCSCDKATYYSNGVLVGNWLEERVGSYKKNRYNHVSIYNYDFTPKKAIDKAENEDLRNRIQIKSEHGDNIDSGGKSDEGPNYFDNFVTTYDLAYQYFPRWIPGTINRVMRFRLLKYEPTEEYLNPFGNLTTRNHLTDEKQEEWVCDVLDPRRPTTSIAKADYIKYDTQAYKVQKWPLIKPVKIKCGIATETVYRPWPPDHPRSLENRVNPITWEGGAEPDNENNCVCKP
ncbi:uncharacterized protein LOC126743109 [Anthonomus grandis grandis]|uniref:uncharacterized protein LOC126743109 n=1 Tax=Anthonomus grandis grandis TaxID=2921223 RepID=UPI0021658D20|nr:uncharacterized protein LOC126743109 [Anthonomus grandis grandis]